MYFVFFINVLILPIIFVATGSYSATIMGAFVQIVGVMMSLTVKGKNYQYAYKIYNIVFFVTTTLILIRYGYLMDQPDATNIFKSGGDEHIYYQRINDVLRFPNLGSILHSTFYDEFVENQGYIFYIRFLGYFSNLFFDGNHIVLQLLGSSIIGCILSVELFKIFLLFFKPRRAYNLTLYSFFLSPFLLYSVVLLRDIHIALIYTIIIYIVIKPYSIRGVLWLLSLVAVAFYIRMENGIFAAIFILYYLYRANKISQIWFSLMIVMIMSFVLINTMLFTEMYDIVSGTNAYYLERSGEISHSFAHTLPHPLREIVVFLMGNFLSPAGYWPELLKSDSIYLLLQAIIHVIFGCVWLLVHAMVIKWMIACKGWQNLSSPLRWLFIIALLFEFANTTQMEMRRVMCIFPILMLVFLYLKHHVVPKKLYRRDLSLVSIYYCAISLLILIFKI